MKKVALIFAFLIGAISGAYAQVPVIDSANLSQSQQIASNTQTILSTDQQVLTYTNQTLQAVTGDRTSVAQGSLSQMALGSGFSLGTAPSLGSIISGGSLSFQGMGSGAQGMVSTLINGLQLVKTISGIINGSTTPFDQSYSNSVNTSAALAGLITSTQGALASRSAAFMAGGQSIGTAPDLKGSIDQNSQIQVQTGSTINELIGTTNVAATAANQANLDRVAAMSQAANALTFTGQ